MRSKRPGPGTWFFTSAFPGTAPGWDPTWVLWEAGNRLKGGEPQTFGHRYPICRRHMSFRKLPHGSAFANSLDKCDFSLRRGTPWRRAETPCARGTAPLVGDFKLSIAKNDRISNFRLSRSSVSFTSQDSVETSHNYNMGKSRCRVAQLLARSWGLDEDAFTLQQLLTFLVIGLVCKSSYSTAVNCISPRLLCPCQFTHSTDRPGTNCATVLVCTYRYIDI